MKNLCRYFVIIIISINYAQEIKKVTFATHWLPQAQFAGCYMAIEKNIYQKYNLDVDLIHSGPNFTAQNLLKEKKVEYAFMFLSTAIVQRSKDIPIVNIGQLSQRSAQLFVVKKEKGITKPEDINGLKVGIWESGFEEIPFAFLKYYNLDVEIVPVASTVTLFLLDGIDVMTTMWYNEYHTILNSGINEDELTTFFFSEYNLDLPEDGIYCLKETYLKDPEKAKLFVQATLEGWEYAFNHPEETINEVLKRMREANIAANRAHQTWMLNRIKDVYRAEGKIFKKGELLKTDFNRVVKVLLDTGKITTVPAFKEFSFGKF
ncbi:MAG: ABC transporter substrate-binding protein [Ignavibacteria bacterium]|jgi:NitT/TauT family transport system substrate-binding protein